MSYGTSNPVEYFGQQVRRARCAAGWTLREFGQRIGYDAGQISRIENGKRPPTELFARMCDRAFPDRDGWFSEFYGLLQNEDYARAILAVYPGVTDEQISERLAARLARQAILTRDDPPAAWFLVDEAALRRCVGSADIMAAQLAHLAGLARLPNITIQVMPDIAHAGVLGGFAVAERAAYIETAVAGQVFEDADIVSGLITQFDTLRNEALRRSESLALIERMCGTWKAAGARAATQAPTAENA